MIYLLYIILYIKRAGILKLLLLLLFVLTLVLSIINNLLNSVRMTTNRTGCIIALLQSLKGSLTPHKLLRYSFYLLISVSPRFHPLSCDCVISFDQELHSK